MINFLILSPLEQFEVFHLISLDVTILGNFIFSITNLTFYALLILFTVVGLHYYSNNDSNLIPNKSSIALETSFATLRAMVRNQIGNNNEIYVPFIYSLFFFVLIGNLISNVPYSFALNASAIVTLGLSVTIFIGVTLLALSKHGLKFFSFFIPGGTPLALVPVLALIELVSYFARAVSLGVRLFSNIFAGHSLMKILATFLYKLFSGSVIIAIFTLIPFAIFLGIVGLELAVSFIQAYVLTILTCSYLKDAIDLH